MINFTDFDIIEYLEEQAVDYKESGKNIGKDCVGICCDCGDSSYHLNIHLDKKIFNCWICGKSGGLVKFVAMMENISYSQAFLEIKNKIDNIKSYDEDKSTVDIVGDILNLEKVCPKCKGWEYKIIEAGIPNKVEKCSCKSEEIIVDKKEIKLPDYIEKFEYGKPYKLYYQYLMLHRLFDLEDFMKWDCYYCSKGEYEHRLIFPVRINQKLVTFATRALSERATLKHRSQPKEDAIIPIKSCLYLYDEYDEGDEVILCEGIFDALRLKSFGYKALAIFSNKLSDAQILLLLDKLPGKIKVILDRGEYSNTMKMWHQVNEFVPISKFTMINKYKDIGECINRGYIKELLEEW